MDCSAKFNKCQGRRRKRRRLDDIGAKNLVKLIANSSSNKTRGKYHNQPQQELEGEQTIGGVDVNRQLVLKFSQTNLAQNDLIKSHNRLVKGVPSYSNTTYYLSNMLSPFGRTALLMVLVVCCSSYTITCQRTFSSESPSPAMFTSQSPLLIGNNPQQQFDGQADGRALPDSQPKPQGNAFDHLVNLLNSYASQQSGLNQNRRPPPLPLNGFRTQQAQNVQATTPGNPFNGPQFQSNRRNINFPNQLAPNTVSEPNNQMFAPSSSPPTPYLTLNRFAGMANPQPSNQGSNQNSNGNSNNRAFNFPAINKIPLNSVGSQQQNRQPAVGALNAGLMPPRGVQPIRLGGATQQQFSQAQGQSVLGGQQRPMQSSSLPPPPALSATSSQSPSNSVKPISGFAPSGPPPSLAANSAMVVVQSPSNGVGPQPSQSQTPNQSETAIGSLLNVSKPDERPKGEENKSDSSTFDGLTGGQAATTTTTTSPPPPTNTTATATASVPSIDQNKNMTVGQQASNDSSWNPVESNGSLLELHSKTKVSLAPSLDIVTVPPGYNPDNQNSQPQNFDIAVSAQMGPSDKVEKPVVVSPSSLIEAISTTSSQSQSTSTQDSSSAEPSTLATYPLPSAAPTAITTIIWTPPPSEQPTTTRTIQPTKTVESRNYIQSTSQSTTLQPTPNRIRDNSLNDEPNLSDHQDPGVVYGKPQTRESKPVPPAGQVQPSPPITGQASFESSVPASGRPYIQPVQMDNQVRPFLAGSQPSQQPSLLKSNHGHSSVPFRPSRPLNGQAPMHVGSGFTITANGNQTMPTGDIQDYVAGQPPFQSGKSPSGSQTSGSFQVSDSNEPTISAHGGQDPANFDLMAQDSSASMPIHKQAEIAHQSISPNISSIASNDSTPTSSAPAQSRVRRPTFKPKPAVPPIRIDSCIVGDDGSCDQSHNERCVTEYGISSCHCKPGYARLSQLRGYCSPVSSFQLSLKIDKLSDDRRLVFNHTLENSNSEEYQYLEFEAIQALTSAFQQTSLAKQFMGTRVNKFFEKKGKVWVNMSVNFELNNLTKTDKIQSVAAQELMKVTQAKQKPLGDSTLVLDGTKETVSRLTDLNECASRDLNDCSKYASCVNEFGGFQCQCLPGFEDKYQNEDKSKHGRICLGCSPSYCSNRGECSITDGQKQCKCRPNFIGARCDIDSEVLAVAIGGSLVGIVILIITFWCLYVFNRRWKREQQKMDAMSATSGLTFNYVNSSTNSLMSPNRSVGGLHRSGGHQVGAMAANYGQRFGAAITGGARAGQHYSADQQAIIGSTSSGSSASSQQIGCNPYTSGYQYEDAGLLIAPASAESSEQTSPTSNSYRGIIGGSGAMHSTAMSQLAGSAYTLSGHHHHYHHHPHHHHGHANKTNPPQITQFHPAADYRNVMHCPPNVYDNRWRTLQQDSCGNTNNGTSKQSALVGYYLVR